MSDIEFVDREQPSGLVSVFVKGLWTADIIHYRWGFELSSLRRSLNSGSLRAIADELDRRNGVKDETE